MCVCVCVCVCRINSPCVSLHGVELVNRAWNHPASLTQQKSDVLSSREQELMRKHVFHQLHRFILSTYADVKPSAENAHEQGTDLLSEAEM